MSRLEMSVSIEPGGEDEDDHGWIHLRTWSDFDDGSIATTLMIESPSAARELAKDLLAAAEDFERARDRKRETVKP